MATGSVADSPLRLLRPLGPLVAAWSCEHSRDGAILWANHMQFLPWIVFALAAIFEVGGDAVVRMGIKNNNIVLMLLGAATLGGYGLIVNSVDWDFAKIFGVYVGAFALVAVLFGKFVFREQISVSTWVGLLIIVCGGLVIQFGK